MIEEVIRTRSIADIEHSTKERRERKAGKL